MSTPRQRSNREQVIQAAGIVSFAFVISRLIGFGRESVLGIYYGTSSLDVNAFTIANVVPETIFYIIAGGALSSAFIPTFASYFARDDEIGAWRLYSAVLNMVILVMLLVCGAVALAAPQLVQFLYRDLVTAQPEILPLAVELLRIMLLSTVIFGASGVVMGALQARQHFLLPAVAPIVYNLGIILGTIWLAPDIRGAAWGAVAGALGHLLIQVPGLRQKKARYVPLLSLRDAGVRQVLRLMPPRLLGLSFGRISFLITQFLGQMMVLGSIRALELAWRLMFMPISIIGQALGIASFPTLSALAAAGDRPGMRRILSDTLRLTFFLGIPATVLVMGLTEPFVATLLEYGAFDAAGTELVAGALFFYALGLTALSAIEVVARAFYALEDTWTPTIAGAIQLAVMGALATYLSLFLFPWLGLPRLGGIALGASLANWLETAALLWLLRRRLGGLHGRHVLDGVLRMSGAALLMLVGIWATRYWLGASAAILQLLVGGIVSGLLYLAGCAVLRVDELREARRLLLRR